MQYKFVITPDLQKWSVSNVFEKFAKAGITKIAMIVTHALFEQVSLEQFVDEYEDGNIETKYFTDVDKAREWLIKV